MGKIEKKKIKDWYTKLTLFKVYGYHCKSDKKSGMVSEVFPQIYLIFPGIRMHLDRYMDLIKIFSVSSFC
jgi:hypothetical protein